MLSLIILSYNDGQSLREIIPEWMAVLKKTTLPFELIISDDGSTDNTKEIVLLFMQTNPELKYIHAEKNEGVGANFRKGVAAARGDLIAYTDGDGQYLPEDILLLLKELGQNEMITGKRLKRADPFLRSVTAAMYNKLLKTIYKLPVKDVNSGLKLYRRHFLESCSPQFSNGPFYDAEYLIKGHRLGMHIKEIPIQHCSRKYGKAAGISARSLRLLFSDLCRQPMKPFTRKNYLSRFIFRLLATA